MKKPKISAFKTAVFAVVILSLLLASSCNDNSVKMEKEQKVEANTETNNKENEELFLQVMQKHLDVVTNRDLVSLKETMAPNGQMQLILPGSEIINGVDGFMDYHSEWFAAPDWSFETKILNTEVGQDLGMAITEIIYREPMRDGKPYSNRMIVSYDLKKIDGHWYVIKDHASSVEKSTDTQ